MRAAAALLLLVAASCGARTVPQQPAPTHPPDTTTPSADPAPPGPGSVADAAPPANPQPASPPDPAPAFREPPTVWILLTKPTAAGRARVQVKGRWTLVTVDGSSLGGGMALDGEAVLTGTTATIGGVTLPASGAELRPATDGDLRVNDRTYPGALRVETIANGKRRLMIATDVETYVASVVNSEIPASFPRETQRAMAINARTYVLAQGTAAPGGPLLVDDSGGSDQEFAGLAIVAEHRRIGADAAASTRGMVLVDGGLPLMAYYHSTCGGMTCPGEVVFGRRAATPGLAGGVACPYCTGSKYFKWDAKVPGAAVVKAAGLTGALESFTVCETTAGGRAVTFDVKAGGKGKRVRAAEFRLQVGPSLLRSTLLDDTTVVAGELVAHGRGWGHGVGLCQMGAKGLGERGETGEGILGLYYPGATLESWW